MERTRLYFAFEGLHHKLGDFSSRVNEIFLELSPCGIVFFSRQTLRSFSGQVIMEPSQADAIHVNKLLRDGAPSGARWDRVEPISRDFADEIDSDFIVDLPRADNLVDDLIDCQDLSGFYSLKSMCSEVHNQAATGTDVSKLGRVVPASAARLLQKVLSGMSILGGASAEGIARVEMV